MRAAVQSQRRGDIGLLYQREEAPFVSKKANPPRQDTAASLLPRRRNNYANAGFPTKANLPTTSGEKLMVDFAPVAQRESENKASSAFYRCA
jgi:hypothetical protein